MRVVVYGTLKKGGSLSQNMENIGATFVDKVKVDGFAMYNLGWFPAIIKQEGSSIHGEIYDVDINGMRILDSVEGYPTLYQKTETAFGTVYYMEDAEYAKHGKLIENGNWKIDKKIKDDY